VSWQPAVRRLGGSALRGPFDDYMDRVSRQEIAKDETQLVAVRALQRLYDQLTVYTPPAIGAFDDAMVRQSLVERASRHAEVAAAEAARLRELGIPLDDDVIKEADATAAAEEIPAAALADLAATDPAPVSGVPHGLYLWGPVGCGKTYVMDMFFESAPILGGRKQRIHFHSFMRDVLQHYHQLSANATDIQRLRYDDDLLRPLAKAIAKQSYLVCFDEMQIPDIATAAILVQLFRHLREYGVIVVATSNREPSKLYSGHLSDAVCAPWVEMMSEHWQVLELESPRDYRKLMLADVDAAEGVEFDPSDAFADTFFTPLGPTAAAKMATSWRHHVGDESKVFSRALTVSGRAVDVHECTANGVARFHFEELCARPLGPADYLAIATEFHTVFLDEVPKMTMQTRDQARRFISLVDALYECNTVLVCSAEHPANLMFVDVADVEAQRYDIMHREMLGEMAQEMDYKGKVFAGQLFTGEEELFASERCVSRLAEMRCYAYRSAGHRPQRGIVGLDGSELEFDGTLDLAPHEHEPSTEAADARPRFSARHFFGAGWFEKLVDRSGSRVYREPSMRE